MSTNKFFFEEVGLDLRVLWTSLAQRLLIPAAQEIIVLNTSYEIISLVLSQTQVSHVAFISSQEQGFLKILASSTSLKSILFFNKNRFIGIGGKNKTIVTPGMHLT